MSELSVSKLSSQTTNTPPIIEDDSANEVGQFCRARVNFNGTGVIAIRDSFNVSSLVDNSAGDYTVNLTNNMPNADYSVGGGSNLNTASAGTTFTGFCTFSKAVGSFNINTPRTDNGVATDMAIVDAIVFGE